MSDIPLRQRLYRDMVRARAFELVLADLWHQGRISGEMHLATGEEAVAAGVVANLRAEDAVALDHRPTAVMTLMGVDPGAMLREALGRQDGLCGGQGGHMHLFDPDRFVASSGIVGSSGPAAVGFGLAAKRLRPHHIACAFFGEGACNQGMLLESFNLAAAWKLPVVFICKDNGWSIVTRSDEVTGGDLRMRAEAFGLRTRQADGLDAHDVYEEARQLIEHARRGEGPGFLLAKCVRLDGHFLGDRAVRLAQHPVAEGMRDARRIAEALLADRGASLLQRLADLVRTSLTISHLRDEHRDSQLDPIAIARQTLDATDAAQLEVEAVQPVYDALAALEAA